MQDLGTELIFELVGKPATADVGPYICEIAIVVADIGRPVQPFHQAIVPRELQLVIIHRLVRPDLGASSTFIASFPLSAGS